MYEIENNIEYKMNDVYGKIKNHHNIHVPKNWPSNIQYINFMNYHKNFPKKSFIKKVLIQKIEDKNHILYGEYGLFATEKINKFDVLGEYTGLITELGGKYVASFHGIDKLGVFGVDAEKAGNELRFINDYLNIGPKPNTILKNTIIDRRPKIFVVATEDIEIGEEILMDYGDEYKDMFIHHT
jgi:hypothetical protein